CTRTKRSKFETDNLGVKCSFYGRGCKWTGVLKELMVRTDSGVTQDDSGVTQTDPSSDDSTAPGVLRPHAHGLLMRCGAEFEKRFQQKHRDEDCPKRQVICQFCELSMLAETESSIRTPVRSSPCPVLNKCSKEEHLDSDCLQQSQPCPFANYGCAHTITTWSCSAWPSSAARRLANEKERLAAELTKNKLAGIERRIACLEKLYRSLVWRIDSSNQDRATGRS
uniref:TRAF-type domain-containing protein n=1 Tax=Macrostomum lignano TaxID=282301 RepID=A0A1I8FPB5_9PLAT